MRSGLNEPFEPRRVAKLVGFTVPTTLLVLFIVFGTNAVSLDGGPPLTCEFKGMTMTYYRCEKSSHPQENAFDEFDSFLKDRDGRLKMVPNGAQKFSDVAEAVFVGFTVKTRRGNPVTVFQSLPCRSPGYMANCHGYTFTGGAFWMFSSQVDTLLNDNSWQPVPAADTRPGDIVVYRQSNGRVCHSARVSGRDQEGHVLVNSKNGFAPLRPAVRATEAAFN